MEILTTIKDTGTLAGILIVLYFLWKEGIIRFGKKKNGIEKLRSDIKTLKENDFHHIEEHLKEINQTLQEVRDYTRDTYNIIKK